MLKEIRRNWYRKKVIEWLSELMPHHHGVEIQNAKTGNVICFVSEKTRKKEEIELEKSKLSNSVFDMHKLRIQSMEIDWLSDTYKILLDGKPVMEMGEVGNLKRFNYGSWVHDVKQIYNAHMELQKRKEKAEYDALFGDIE